MYQKCLILKTTHYKLNSLSYNYILLSDKAFQMVVHLRRVVVHTHAHAHNAVVVHVSGLYPISELEATAGGVLIVMRKNACNLDIKLKASSIKLV